MDDMYTTGRTTRLQFSLARTNDFRERGHEIDPIRQAFPQIHHNYISSNFSAGCKQALSREPKKLYRLSDSLFAFSCVCHFLNEESTHAESPERSPRLLFGKPLDWTEKFIAEKMSTGMKILGGVVLLMNSVCLLRLGLLPAIFFGRNYALYKTNFWVSLSIAFIFSLSEGLLIWILFTEPQSK